MNLVFHTVLMVMIYVVHTVEFTKSKFYVIFVTFVPTLYIYH